MDPSPTPERHAERSGAPGPADDDAVPACTDGGSAAACACAVERAAGGPTPLVFASPHSGRGYPAALMAATRLDADTIRRSEDAFVDRLIAGAPALGAALITARQARAWIDVNRDAYELDPAMFEEELPAFARGRTARVAAGIGAIARLVGEGQEIYARKLTFAEAEARIATVHRPYHAALAALVQDAKAAHGVALLVDWHSMPSVAAASRHGGRGADVVLGDRFGAACAGQITALAQGELERRGYVVARNAPYAGGYTTEHYGRPAEGVHALQVEISRSLYMDETTLTLNAGYSRLQADLERLTAALAALDWDSLRR